MCFVEEASIQQKNKLVQIHSVYHGIPVSCTFSIVLIVVLRFLIFAILVQRGNKLYLASRSL